MKERKVNMSNILISQNHEEYARQMLKEAKLSIRALVMDQDGTVKGGDDPQYQKANVAELLQKIARAGKYPAIITASGASALKSFASLIDFYAQEKITIPTFIGIGNGTALYGFDRAGRSEIYNHGLTLREVKAIVEVWKNVYKTLRITETDLQPKGLETFKKFMETDWIGYIPEEYLVVFRQYGGRCFTEQIKVTVVFPSWETEKQRELVKKLQKELDKSFGKNKYLASRGDETFLHITHTFEVDPKLFALRTIMKELNLTPNEVVAFGDMPLDNDRGLLVESKLPYTFTNKYFDKPNIEKPPFILPESELTPIGSVYKAVEFLLT